ncbi:hypothetical protein P4502_09895 [Peribacillus frigoritolerans]|uniref:hypothetical protein n=1 Tax=Peribacillus frigoritolerans TaxID=450367 RepID=UPI002E1CC5AE|nr:hypothetical protein [Peribacillus frigoritolerans]
MLQLREGRVLEIGQRVRVYRNLHKDKFSIQDAKTKKVIAYGDGILLSNVQFKVEMAGREKVRKTKQKRVHAFIIGDFLGYNYELEKEFSPIYYNPYETDQFVCLETKQTINSSRYCICTKNKCYVK